MGRIRTRKTGVFVVLCGSFKTSYCRLGSGSPNSDVVNFPTVNDTKALFCEPFTQSV
jgi:hypothetical protein